MAIGVDVKAQPLVVHKLEVLAQKLERQINALDVVLFKAVREVTHHQRAREREVPEHHRQLIAVIFEQGPCGLAVREVEVGRQQYLGLPLGDPAHILPAAVEAHERPAERGHTRVKDRGCPI
jgi:hypothetical protein